MRLTPQPPDISEGSGFGEDNDLFSYRPFAERLTNLVRNIDEPLVAILDGEWGSGKSTFVRQWIESIRTCGASVIFFDAFGNDHHEDAFLALSAEIHALAEETLGADQTVSSGFLDKARKAGSILAPIAWRIAARAGTAGLLSADDLRESGEAANAAAKALSDESSKLMEKVISERFRQASEERAAFEGFRIALSELSEIISKNKSQNGRGFPLIFIVDELDRCNPNFAISVIERIKHLFFVDNVFFLLVTNLSHLESVFKGPYGDSFDARQYLEKFYQFRISLPVYTEAFEGKRTKYISYLWKELDIRFPDSSVAPPILKELAELANDHNLSLRQLERVMSHMALLSAATKEGNLIIPTLVAGLCVMRHTHPEIYEKVITNRASGTDLEVFLHGKLKRNKDNENIKWWKYAMGHVMMQSEIDKFNLSVGRYGIESGQQLLSRLASHIESLGVT